jgi:GNAT superfamily N-acetyltransferase
MRFDIVSTSDRPDLVPVVAEWLWNEFARDRGRTLDIVVEAVARSVTAQFMPRTFVLLGDDEPMGTASLTAHDLDERPDLTPWLAGVFMRPHVRGRGYASRLISAVEREAGAASVSVLWLYTRQAERVYARAGWRTVETIQRDGAAYALMRRDLALSASSPLVHGR